MKKIRSLATKLIVLLLLVLFLGQGLGFILFIMSTRNSKIESLNEKITQNGRLLAELSVDPILEKDTESLGAYLDVIFQDKDFISLSVFDIKDNIVGEKSREAEHATGSNPFYAEPTLNNETPVLFDNRKIGYVIVTASSNRINGEILKHEIAAFIHQLILSVVIFFVVIAFFGINIRKPLLSLSSASDRLSEGDMSVSLKSANSLEFAALMESFNSLVGQFKGTIRRIHSTVSDVTMAIKQINLISNKVIKGTDDQLTATHEVIAAMGSSEEAEKDIISNTQNLSEFSEENLSSIIEIKSSSEEISESSEQLFQVSSDSYSTIAEMVSAAKEISKNTEELSVSTEQISASIEQISANTKEVDESSKESANFAAKVREIASEQGMLTVADAMAGMEEIITAVDTTLELVRSLKSKSKAVEKVLSVIDDVTKQTNLLSVNAAILASQAGEYGKGFSVVADEIKTLADRTQASAKEITGIIKSIQKGVEETTNVTEKSKIIVENGNNLVVKTGEAFREVINSAQSSSEMASNIHRATEEQVRGVTQIREAMDLVMRIVEHVTAATHEHEIGSEHLIGVAERIKGISEVIRKSMQEQTAGVYIISKNLELANEKIKQIAGASSRHGQASEAILLAAEKISGFCGGTHSFTEEMRTSFDILHKEAEALLTDMERFRFE